MNREDLKEIIEKIINKVQDAEAPQPGCLFTDNTCDVTTKYALNEEG